MFFYVLSGLTMCLWPVLLTSLCQECGCSFADHTLSKWLIARKWAELRLHLRHPLQVPLQHCMLDQPPLFTHPVSWLHPCPHNPVSKLLYICCVPLTVSISALIYKHQQNGTSFITNFTYVDPATLQQRIPACSWLGAHRHCQLPNIL